MGIARLTMCLIGSVVALLSAACTHIISDESLRLVEPKLHYNDLRQNPQLHKGQYVMLAGAIVSVTNKNNGDEIEVVHFKTNDKGEITDTSSSDGRFLAISSSFLDPVVYQPGLLVTIVGDFRGNHIMPLGEADYSYPVIGIKEIHLFGPEEHRPSPQIHFGIGVGTIFH